MPVFTKRTKNEIIPKGWRRVRLGEKILADREYKIAVPDCGVWNMSGNIWENCYYKTIGSRISHFFRPIIIKK